MKETDLAWAAGFFDGEGSTSYSEKKSKRKDAPHRIAKNRTIKFSINQCNKANLEKFQAVFNVGKIYGPKQIINKSNPHYKYKPVWAYYAGRYNAISFVLHLMWPYLSIEKKKQAIDAIKSYRRYKIRYSIKREQFKVIPRERHHDYESPTEIQS